MSDCVVITWGSLKTPLVWRRDCGTAKTLPWNAIDRGGLLHSLRNAFSHHRWRTVLHLIKRRPHGDVQRLWTLLTCYWTDLGTLQRHGTNLKIDEVWTVSHITTAPADFCYLTHRGHKTQRHQHLHRARSNICEHRKSQRFMHIHYGWFCACATITFGRDADWEIFSDCKTFEEILLIVNLIGFWFYFYVYNEIVTVIS